MLRLPAVALLIGTSTAFAFPVSLGFDGLQNGEQVLNYYDGGYGGNGSGPGPNYGITFTTGIAASSTTIAFGPSAVLTAPSVTMDLLTPIQGLSFYFAGAGTVTVYSGLDGSGTKLDSQTLTGPLPFADFTKPYQSVVFTGNGLKLDSITTGGPAVIPEPTSMALVSGGVMLLLIGFVVKPTRLKIMQAYFR